MSVSVCVFVSLSLCVYVCLTVIIFSELHVRSLPIFLYMLAIVVAQSSCGGVLICYVFPILWMASYLHISKS